MSQNKISAMIPCIKTADVRTRNPVKIGSTTTSAEQAHRSMRESLHGVLHLESWCHGLCPNVLDEYRALSAPSAVAWTDFYICQIGLSKSESASESAEAAFEIEDFRWSRGPALMAGIMGLI
jgi:hypothetical protein